MITNSIKHAFPDNQTGILEEVAFFDLYPSSNSANFNGTWSNYPYFPSGVVAVSHIEGGLFLLYPQFLNADEQDDLICFMDDQVSDIVIETGFVGPVSLSVESGLPEGATATFSANNVGPGAYTLTISNLPSVSASYTIVVKGIGTHFTYNSQYTFGTYDCINDVLGCTDSAADNYNSMATINDGSCTYPCSDITFTLLTDCYPGETSWELVQDATGNAIVTGSGENDYETTTWSGCIADGCYTFNVYDAYGDGVNGATYGCSANGDYHMVDDASGNTIFQMSDPAFGSLAVHNFCVTAIVGGCMDTAACNYDATANGDDGSCLYLDSCGDCGGNGISGCTNSGSPNYDPSATCDDGSCLLDATALSMDATSDYVVVPSDASTDFGTGDFTFEAWMMIDITGDAYEGMITSFNTFDEPSDNGGWAFHKNESSVRFLVGDSNINGEFEGVNYTIQTDTWYHFAGVRSDNTLYLYVDGLLVGSVASERELPNLPIHFGKRYVNQSVQQGRGSIDEFRLWSKALTSVEINARMNCELQGDEDDLVRYYKFNQGFDGADSSTETTLVSDAINNPVDGSLINFSLVGTYSNWIRGNELTAPCGSLIYGCTDLAASNYNDQANVDDGSCASYCLGDFDGDSSVNTSDLLLFLGDFGCVNTPCIGDLDGDGFTNTSDLLIFLSRFGIDCL